MTGRAVTPADARELLQYVDLTGIHVYEVSGKVDEDDDRQEQPGDMSPTIGIRVSADALTVRMRLEVASNGALYVADMAVEYSFDRPVNLLGTVVAEFVERVGALAVFPFVRESVFTSATRMGREAPVLGIMKAGEFGVGDVDGPDFAASTRSVTVAELGREIGLKSSDVLEILAELQVDVPSARSKVPGSAAAKIRESAYRVEHGDTEASDTSG